MGTTETDEGAGQVGDIESLTAEIKAVALKGGAKAEHRFEANVVSDADEAS